jgi:hypothetical protein
MNSSKVYIIILNWNGWQDTIECLESVFRNNYPAYTVIVCDNSSHDGSLEHIKLWADGRLNVLVPSHNSLRSLTYPPVIKPIPYIEYNRKDAEKGGARDRKIPLVLIQTGGNLGFAGGNNVGLRYILAREDAEYVWLLNNDTVIRLDALSHLIERAKSDPQIGSIGSTILLYDRTDIIDVAGGGIMVNYLGGSYQSQNGKSVHAVRYDEFPIYLDYITGASCLLPVEIIKKVGLMDETYFHFWEDADMGFRIRKYGYKNAYESKSLIYHKVGVSIGGKSSLADYYELRSAIIYYRKHYGLLFINVILLKFILKVMNRIHRNQMERIPILAKAFCQGFLICLKK